MKYIPYILIAVLVGIILFGRREVEVKEISTTDTVTVYRFDTLFEERPVVRYKRIVDTMYIEKEGVRFELPVESKHYSKNNVYDVWVSGYNAKMDSIRTYNRVEYRTITNTIEKTLIKKEWNVYGECGFYSICDNFSPYIGISIASPKTIKFGANLGYSKDGICYGLNVGFKLK